MSTTTTAQTGQSPMYTFALPDDDEKYSEQYFQAGLCPSWVVRRPKLSGSSSAAPLPGDSGFRCLFLVRPNDVTQDDAECWEERGDKCCYDFSEFNGENLNSIGR